MDDLPICVRVSTERRVHRRLDHGADRLWYAIIPSRGFNRNVTLLHSGHWLMAVAVALYLNLIDFRGSHAGKHFGEELRRNNSSPGTRLLHMTRIHPT
jgi:hypothetical protein